MSLAEKLVIRGNGSEVDGPDIGFLRLAPHQAATLNSTNVFFNLSKREEAVLGNKNAPSEYFEGLCGIVAEWTEDKAGEVGFHRLRGFRGLFGVGCVVKTQERDGHDFIDFETTYNGASKAPLSYKGMSGGALWRVGIKTDGDGRPTVSSKMIFGVAFHQSDLVNGVRTIKCHGAKSVYGALIRQVRSRWPAA